MMKIFLKIFVFEHSSFCQKPQTRHAVSRRLPIRRENAYFVVTTKLMVWVTL